MEVDKGRPSKMKFNLSVPSAILMFILSVGAILRFYDLGKESYWIDEMSTVIEGQQTFHQLLTVGRLDQPPAYYFPFHLWVQFFGDSEISTRSFSALIGVASIILIYLIGRQLFGEQVGLLCAFLMAISEFQITYSQMARFYIFFEFTTLLSVLFFILALRSKQRLYFTLYVVSSALMVCSHAFGLFILAVQNLFFFMNNRKYRETIVVWIVCQVVILLLVLPYFSPLVFGKAGMKGEIDSNIGSNNMNIPTVLDPLRSIYHFIFSARRERSWMVIIVNYAVAGLLFMGGVGLHAFRQGKAGLAASTRALVVDLKNLPNLMGNLYFLTLWLFGPILLPFILSLVIAPIYKDYYTISAAPALYVLLALGMFGIRKVVPLLVSLGVLVIMIAPNLSQYYTTDINEQWKEAAQYIEKNSEPDEVIVFAPNMDNDIQQRTFSSYYQGTLQGCGLNNDVVDPVMIAEDLRDCITTHRRFWMIVYGTPVSDTVNRYQSFIGGNYINVDLINEQKFKTLYVYLFEIAD